MEHTSLSEFQLTVLNGISELKAGQSAVMAKMNTLVGADGTNGKVGDIEERLRVVERSVPENLGKRLGSLEGANQREIGRRGVWDVIRSVGAVLAGGVIEYFASRH